MSTFLHIHDNNVGTDLFDIFIADVTIRILAQTGEPLAPVRYYDFFDAATAVIEFQIYYITDAVAGS